MSLFGCATESSPPSAPFVNSCKKDQLVQIVDHYCVTVTEKMHEDELRNVVLSSLFAQGVCK